MCTRLRRTTYEMLWPGWSTQTTGDGPGPLLNRMQKYVVSTTLQTAPWKETTISPTATTSPRASNPGVYGKGEGAIIGHLPLLISISARLTAAAITLNRTSPGGRGAKAISAECS